MSWVSIAFRLVIALTFGVGLFADHAQLQAEELEWKALTDDGVHDVRSPAIRMLQPPPEALSALAKDVPDATIGNQVRWVHAIEKGLIKPRANIQAGTEIRVLDLDIFLNVGGGMPVVRFPHRAHTYWLDCANCHEHLFKSKAGQNPLSMAVILEGEQCGVCHGAVAFPLIVCQRCHSIPQPEFAKMRKEQPGLVIGSGGQAKKQP